MIVLTEKEYDALEKAARAAQQEKTSKERLCTSKRLLYTILATTLILTVLTALGAFLLTET